MSVNPKEAIRISKSMSYLLRHGAKKENINIKEAGFISVSDVLDWLHQNQFQVSETDIQQIVADDSKGRYHLETQNGKLYIRANQGHSLEVKELDLKPITLDNVSNYEPVMHGSYSQHVDSIKEGGLKSMSRQHVHMVSLQDPNWPSLIRRDIDTYIIVNITDAIKHGVKFYQSTNNVILCDGVIPAKYLTILSRCKSNCYGVIVIGMDQRKTPYLAMVKTPKNYWSYPKGKGEKKEISLQAALRELKEETNINVSDLVMVETPGGALAEKSDKGNIATMYYVAYYRHQLHPANLELQPEDADELVEARWIPYQNIVNWQDSDKGGYLRERRIELAKSLNLDQLPDVV